MAHLDRLPSETTRLPLGSCKAAAEGTFSVLLYSPSLQVVFLGWEVQLNRKIMVDITLIHIRSCGFSMYVVYVMYVLGEHRLIFFVSRNVAYLV